MAPMPPMLPIICYIIAGFIPPIIEAYGFELAAPEDDADAPELEAAPLAPAPPAPPIIACIIAGSIPARGLAPAAPAPPAPAPPCIYYIYYIIFIAFPIACGFIICLIISGLLSIAATYGF